MSAKPPIGPKPPRGRAAPRQLPKAATIPPAPPPAKVDDGDPFAVEDFKPRQVSPKKPATSQDDTDNTENNVLAEEPNVFDSEDTSDDEDYTKPAKAQPKGKRHNPHDDGSRPDDNTVNAAMPVDLATCIAVPPSRTLQMDGRKLSKPQQAKLAVFSGKGRSKAVDSMFRAAQDVARAKLGNSGLIVGSNTANLVVGIPSPSLAMEYLFCQDCFPLSLLIQVDGPPSSAKTSILYEFFRWFRLAGGGAHLIEVDKSSPSDVLLRSVVGYDLSEACVTVDKAPTLEAWQALLTHRVEAAKVVMTGTKEKPGPGKTIPVCLGIDAFTAKSAAETGEAVRESGHASRTHPIDANLITQFLKVFPPSLDGWPFAAVFTNYEKTGTDAKGRPTRRTPGGSQMTFQESFEFSTHVTKPEVNNRNWDGIQVELRCRKNSLGPAHRRIPARMLWWHEEDKSLPNDHPQHWRQRTMWDWGWADVKMLLEVTDSKSRDPSGKARLEKVDFHIRAESVGDVQNSAWSATLGMKAKDAVPWGKLAKMIHQNEEVKNTIRGALGIYRRPFLAGDYLQQITKLAEDLP